jgi:intracellular septation protein
VYTNVYEYIMTVSALFSPHTLKRVLLGAVLEFGPIFVFIGAFKHFHVYQATMFLMIATIVSVIATYRLQKRLPYVALYVAFLTIGFGYLTIAHRQPKFIQMRDTLYDITCAITLLIGLMLDIPFLKFAFNEVLPMTTRAWYRLTYVWTGFFIASAVLNEYIRRTHSLHDWFAYKGVMVIATLVFGLVSLWVYYEPKDK